MLPIITDGHQKVGVETVNKKDVAEAYNSLLQNHHQDPEPTLLIQAQKKFFIQKKLKLSTRQNQ